MPYYIFEIIAEESGKLEIVMEGKKEMQKVGDKLYAVKSDASSL